MDDSLFARQSVTEFRLSSLHRARAEADSLLPMKPQLVDLPYLITTIFSHPAGSSFSSWAVLLALGTQHTLSPV